MNAKEANALLDEDIQYFTLPITNIPVKYNKPDLVEGAIRDDLPSWMSQSIKTDLKGSLKGKKRDQAEVEKEMNDKDFTDAEVTDLIVKSKMLLKRLAIEPKFGDISNDETVAISRIPATDCLAFLQAALYSNQTSALEGGGTVTSEEVAKFSSGKRGK